MLAGAKINCSDCQRTQPSSFYPCDCQLRSTDCGRVWRGFPWKATPLPRLTTSGRQPRPQNVLPMPRIYFELGLLQANQHAWTQREYGQHEALRSKLFLTRGRATFGALAGRLPPVESREATCDCHGCEHTNNARRHKDHQAELESHQGQAPTLEQASATTHFSLRCQHHFRI